MNPRSYHSPFLGAIQNKSSLALVRAFEMKKLQQQRGKKIINSCNSMV